MSSNFPPPVFFPSTQPSDSGPGQPLPQQGPQDEPGPDGLPRGDREAVNRIAKALRHRLRRDPEGLMAMADREGLWGLCSEDERRRLEWPREAPGHLKAADVDHDIAAALGSLACIASTNNALRDLTVLAELLRLHSRAPKPTETAAGRDDWNRPALAQRDDSAPGQAQPTPGARI